VPGLNQQESTVMRSIRSSISDCVLARVDRLSVVASVAVLGTVSSASAAIVTWNSNLVIPATVEGMYINIVAQTFATDPAAVAGWDLNIYSSPIPGGAPDPGSLLFAGTTLTASSDGFVAQNLSPGAAVGPSTSFINLSVSVFDPNWSSGWQLNATNYFGFQLTIGADLRYGYGVMQVGATGADRTLLSLSYEDSGAAITIPVPIPAPGAVALLGIAGGAASGRRRHPA
jgi:hypothetical protein